MHKQESLTGLRAEAQRGLRKKENCELESPQEPRQHSALAFLFLLFSLYFISYTRYLCDSSHRLADDISPRSGLLSMARDIRPLSSAFSISSFCSQLFPAPLIPVPYALDRDSDCPSFDPINHRQWQSCNVPSSLSRVIPVLIVRWSDTLRGVHLSYYVVDAFIALNQ